MGDLSEVIPQQQQEEVSAIKLSTLGVEVGQPSFSLACVFA